MPHRPFYKGMLACGDSEASSWSLKAERVLYNLPCLQVVRCESKTSLPMFEALSHSSQSDRESLYGCGRNLVKKVVGNYRGI
jgi:hypothetical protein